MRRHTAVSYTVLLDDQFRGLRNNDSSFARKLDGQFPLGLCVDAMIPVPSLFLLDGESTVDASREFLSRPPLDACWIRSSESSLFPLFSKRGDDLASTFGEEGRLS